MAYCNFTDDLKELYERYFFAFCEGCRLSRIEALRLSVEADMNTQRLERLVYDGNGEDMDALLDMMADLARKRYGTTDISVGESLLRDMLLLVQFSDVDQEPVAVPASAQKWIDKTAQKFGISGTRVLELMQEVTAPFSTVNKYYRYIAPEALSRGRVKRAEKKKAMSLLDQLCLTYSHLRTEISAFTDEDIKRQLLVEAVAAERAVLIVS